MSKVLDVRASMRKMADKKLVISKPVGVSGVSAPLHDGGKPSPEALANLAAMRNEYLQKGMEVDADVENVLKSSGTNFSAPIPDIDPLSGMAKDTGWVQITSGDNYGMWVKRDEDPVDTIQKEDAPTHPVAGIPDRLEEYASRRDKVSYVFDVGTFNTEVCDLVVTRYAIYVVNKVGTSSFTPNPCSEFTLEHGDNAYKCSYPATRAILEDLGLEVMVLIRQD